MTTNTYAEERGYDLLSKFNSVRDFNNQFEQAMLSLKSVFTKSEYIALNKLRKFAGSAIAGVAWCKAQKAVAATHMDALIGVSRSTFNRMLRKAASHNLLKVIRQERSNKYQTHNVYVFNRANEVVEIVSNSHTIDVADSVQIGNAISLDLSDLPLQKQVKELKKTPISDIENESEVQKNVEQTLSVEEQRQYVEKYATNEYQVATFRLIEAMPMANAIKAQAHVIALRVGTNATITDFICAKTVLLNMSVAAIEGTQFDNAVGAFTASYNNAKTRPNNKPKPAEKMSGTKTVPFYNWLKERSHASGRTLRNWVTGDN
ncbi:hypothetical protein 8F11_86 [uncultured Caudovirales phage]|uniref:Uncharacterized protein n=1 Tax=uncultured Caudovirales phage TaxID=2100421 RepID=A0A2H4J7R7_9CAUD|nr:hypothetical protein 8F11_86 [uncultured Caudovirales phage]